MAPEEGFPTPVGTGWLIPTPSGLYQLSCHFPALPALDLFLASHSGRPGQKGLVVNKVQGTGKTLGGQRTVTIGIIVLTDTPGEIVGVTDIIPATGF